MSKHRVWNIMSIVAIVIGGILMSSELWADKVFYLAFGGHGDFGGDVSVPQMLLVQVLSILEWGWSYGIHVFVAGVAVFILTLPLSPSRPAFTDTHRIGLASLTIAGCYHLGILIFSMGLFCVPVGSAIRPMVWTMSVLQIAAITCILALPLSVLALFKEKPKSLGILAFIFSLTPVIFAIGILRLAVFLRNLEVEG
jgi:hypothetical protein